MLFILVCKNSSSGTTRSTRLSDYFHVLWKLLWMVWTLFSFLTVWILPVANKRREIPCAENVSKPCQLNQAQWNFLPYSSSCFPQIFMRHLLKWSTPRYRKAETPRVPRKVWTMLVWSLLLGIRIIVQSCTECSTSNIYLCLEDNRSSFSQVSLKSENRDARPQTTGEIYVFWKTKIWRQAVEDGQIYI